MTDLPASPSPTPPPLGEAHSVTRRITTLSVGVATLLILIKTFAVAASGSVSILASLADSGLDLIASLATFYAVRWAAAPPDDEHRYGHGKGEALAALVQAGLIVASAVFIAWASVQRMLNPEPVTAGVWGVGVMLAAIAITSWLVWMQTRALAATNSLAVAGDRAHYAADIAANVVVLIGVASGAFLDAPGLDAAAGLVVAVWLAWGAIALTRSAADHLLDRAVPEADRAAITAAVLADPRISGLHQLRTRMAGSVIMVQMHVDLEPTLTLEAAHAILVEAETRILAAFPAADILLHPDPHGRAEPHGGAFAEVPAPLPVESVPQTLIPAKGPWS